ncbi:MAG: SPOR domain-containing protein [Muribaculaceae bacterium]|nr:SPOR domain-containing protein [Muribaculaceae bacterium]MBQ1584196.1 SPOR domain-containing protein [Muribaculaceae bacterium]
MLRKLHIRALCLCMMLIVAMAASAQQPQITERLNRNGQVTVDAPKELVKRNNADLGKQPQSSNSNKKVKEKDKKNVDPKSDEEKLNELDEDTTKDSKKDEDKKKDEEKKKEEVTPKKPKRNHTSQQTIESRGVGFRIQAYTDNNPRTAKAAAQRRARDIAMKFPQYRSYISYKAPAWRLRIGDFKTQREAQAALQRIKSVYPKFAREMVIVRDRINVWSND